MCKFSQIYSLHFSNRNVPKYLCILSLHQLMKKSLTLSNHPLEIFIFTSCVEIEVRMKNFHASLSGNFQSIQGWKFTAYRCKELLWSICFKFAKNWKIIFSSSKVMFCSLSNVLYSAGVPIDSAYFFLILNWIVNHLTLVHRLFDNWRISSKWCDLIKLFR